MKNLISVLLYSVCIIPLISLLSIPAQGLYPETDEITIVSNLNFTSVPFGPYPSNASSNCDFTSYPDFCIPPPPPNLNCDEVEGRDFTVFPPDPHGFDRDKDGEGCETSE